MQVFIEPLPLIILCKFIRNAFSALLTEVIDEPPFLSRLIKAHRFHDPYADRCPIAVVVIIVLAPEAPWTVVAICSALQRGNRSAAVITGEWLFARDEHSARLDVESEVHHIAVLDDIGPSFLPHLS